MPTTPPRLLRQLQDRVAQLRLEPGTYRLHSIQTDLIGNRATSSEIPVTIVHEPVENRLSREIEEFRAELRRGRREDYGRHRRSLQIAVAVIAINLGVIYSISSSLLCVTLRISA